MSSARCCRRPAGRGCGPGRDRWLARLVAGASVAQDAHVGLPAVDRSRVRATLLDMDGTLVASDAAVERAWVAWAGEYGIPVAQTLGMAHGNPSLRTARQLLPGLDDDAVRTAAQRQLDLQYDDLSDVRAGYGAPALLAVLARRRLPWAVVTSADRRLA